MDRQESIPQESRKIPHGAKLLVGCLGIAALLMVLLAVGVGIGGFALKRGVESAFGGLDEHRDATETLRRLETEHPFEVPADGVVTEDRLVRYLAVNDAAWEELAKWAGEMVQPGEGSGEDGPLGLRRLVSGAKALAGSTRARIVLAEALAREGMSLGEFTWIGVTMSRAADAADGSQDPRGVPKANLHLVESYGPRIPRLGHDPAAETPGRETVLAVAILWGMAEVPTWQAMGLDSFRIPVSR